MISDSLVDTFDLLSSFFPPWFLTVYIVINLFYHRFYHFSENCFSKSHSLVYFHNTYCVSSTLRVVILFLVCDNFWHHDKHRHRRLVPQFFLVQHVQFLDRQVVLPRLHRIRSLVEVQECRCLKDFFKQQIVTLDKIVFFNEVYWINDNFLIRSCVVFVFLSLFTNDWTDNWDFITIMIFCHYWNDEIVVRWTVCKDINEDYCIHKIYSKVCIFKIVAFDENEFNSSTNVLLEWSALVCGSLVTFQLRTIPTIFHVKTSPMSAFVLKSFCSPSSTKTAISVFALVALASTL